MHSDLPMTTFYAKTEEDLQNILNNVNNILWDSYGMRLNKKKDECSSVEQILPS
jgi:hypothetical protein